VDVPGRVGEDIGFTRTKSESKSNPILIATIDTGIDHTHPDLAAHVFRKPSECELWDKYKACLQKGTKAENCQKEMGNLDSDGDGYPMDCSGWNMADGGNPFPQTKGNPDSEDTVGHGTHIAGVIGALKNEKGIVGVLQSVRILPVKVISISPNVPVRPQSFEGPLAEANSTNSVTAFVDNIARGVLYAVKQNARVMLVWVLLSVRMYPSSSVLITFLNKAELGM
jgi:subtilisin family serine protease